MIRIANLKSFSKPFLVKFLFLALVLALIVSLSVAQVQAKATTVTTNYRTDLNLSVFVACAARGAGETVQISGPLQIVFVTTLDGKGGFQSKYEFQTKGVIGSGLSSGSTYRGTGAPHGMVQGTVGSASSFTDSFKMTGKGSSFLVQATVHVSANSSGALTVSVDNFSVSCKRGGYPSYP